MDAKNTNLVRRAIAKARYMLDNTPIAERARRRERLRILNADFIASGEYARMMMHGYDPALDGANSAELRTDNFAYRHFIKNRVLGAWRWLGAFEKRETIGLYVFSDELTGLDLGGARGPISLNVDICDRLPHDIFKRPVRFNDLAEVPDTSLDYVWSSHTFEHLPALDDVLGVLRTKLKPGAPLITLVPAYTCQRWRSGVHAYKDECGDSSHLYTFYLSRDESRVQGENACAIDTLVGGHLSVEVAQMVGDNSIFIVARA